MASRDSRADDDDDDDADSEREDQKEKLVIKKKGMGSEARASLAANVDVDAQLLTPLEQRRQKFKQKKRVLQGREDTVFSSFIDSNWSLKFDPSVNKQNICVLVFFDILIT